MSLFAFNMLVIGLVILAIAGGWLRNKLTRTTLYVHNPHSYRKGDIMSMSHGTDSSYNGRYKIIKVNESTVTARKTFKQ